MKQVQDLLSLLTCNALHAVYHHSQHLICLKPRKASLHIVDPPTSLVYTVETYQCRTVFVKRGR